MGLKEKIEDKFVKVISKAETVRVPYMQLAEIVRNEFITGQDALQLEEVLKTSKGGFFQKKSNEI